MLWLRSMLALQPAEQLHCKQQAASALQVKPASMTRCDASPPLAPPLQTAASTSGQVGSGSLLPRASWWHHALRHTVQRGATLRGFVSAVVPAVPPQYRSLPLLCLRV